MEHGLLFTLLACIVGLLMTWGVGANDLANIISTTLGSKAISLRNAIIIAIVFEFAGAYLGGVHVTNTMRNGIIDLAALNGTPQLLVFGMMAVLLAGTFWMGFASYLGLPVSITNAIVGSIVGYGVVVLGPHAIHWQKVIYIAISWICSPTIAGIIAYGLFISIQVLILGTKDPIANIKRYIGIYLFLVGFVLSAITVLKGIEHIGIHLSTQEALLLATAIGISVTIIGCVIMNRIDLRQRASRRDKFEYIEKVFAILMVFTACAMVFAHGSNDVSIAVGPMAVIITLAQGHDPSLAIPLPQWLIFLGCTGVVLGLLMYGTKVIQTVGSKITALTPSRAYAATISAASAVVFSNSLGIPVSTTQTLVGAVLGVGMARGIGALNLRVIRNIFLSWIVTVPAASLLTIVFYYLLKALAA